MSPYSAGILASGERPTLEGLSVGDRVEVLEGAPFDGPVTLRVGSATHARGRGLADAVPNVLDGRGLA